MRRSVLLVLLALGGCGARRAATTLPACVRAEGVDHTGGVQEFSFDADGNLTGIIELDNDGSELARTRVEWSPTAIVVTRSGAFPSVSRGVLGAHGELLSWTTDAGTLTLRWNGTFAATATPAAERFAFETYYHLLVEQPLLPLDTAKRGVWPRMRAFVFDGTVTIGEDTRASYVHGHQVSRMIRGVTTTTTWRGDEPVEEATSDGARRTFTSAGGHLTRITGGPEVTFLYDHGRLRRVRTDHGSGAVFEVEVSGCMKR